HGAGIGRQRCDSKKPRSDGRYRPEEGRKGNNTCRLCSKHRRQRGARLGRARYRAARNCLFLPDAEYLFALNSPAMTVNVLEFEKHGFAQFCAEMGEKPFRARQLMRWIHQYGVDNFDAMTDISKPLRERLSIAAEVRAPRVVRATTAAD